MFNIIESGITRRTIATVETFAAAEAYAESIGSAFFEADAAHPGCADFITASGVVYAVEPVGFTLN